MRLSKLNAGCVNRRVQHLCLNKLIREGIYKINKDFLFFFLFYHKNKIFYIIIIIIYNHTKLHTQGYLQKIYNEHHLKLGIGLKNPFNRQDILQA